MSFELELLLVSIALFTIITMLCLTINAVRDGMK